MNSIFDAAKSCYEGYSTSLAAPADNVAHVVSESAMTITCNDASASYYYLTMTAAEMTQFTYYVTVGCNYQAYWTINVASGISDVVFSGDSFPAVPGAVVYNVQGCRTIQVRDTAINGHVLATCGTLNQTGGVILGKTVVGDVIMSLQINKEDVCQTVTDVEIVIEVDEPRSECTFVAVNADFIQVGDELNVEGSLQRLIVSSVQDRCITIDNDEPITVLFSAGSKAGTINKASNAGTGARPNEPNTSSASIVSVSVALIAIIALLF